ncbi:hypothetical protein O1449_07525 [Acinetobacter sp. TR3]|nr:hypothetical protein O1449_07525 [Acinetobacter sp. TR3]
MFKVGNIRKGLIPIVTFVFAGNYAYSSETASQLHATKQRSSREKIKKFKLSFNIDI